MIRCLVTGRLHDMPQARTSANGNPFSTAKLRADGKDGATVWTSIIAFGELAERLATLPAGAALSVSGRRSLRRPGRLAAVMRRDPRTMQHPRIIGAPAWHVFIH